MGQSVLQRPTVLAKMLVSLFSPNQCVLCFVEAFQAQMSLGLQNHGAGKKKMMILDNKVECHNWKWGTRRTAE